jgi:hypothetical protein
MPAIAVNGIEEVISAWMDFKYAPPGFTGDIFLRQSPDSGGTWNPIIELFSNHTALISDVVISGDTIHLAWEDEVEGVVHTSIQYARSTDGGNSWGETRRLDDTFDDSRYPALAASGGRAFAVWKESRANPDTSGLFFSYSPAEPDAAEDDRDLDLPDVTGLSAYPNPFNSSVVISYRLVEGGDIQIVNNLGQLIRKFETLTFGQGRVAWDGTDMTGSPVAGGIYFVKLQAGRQTKSLKLICVK